MARTTIPAELVAVNAIQGTLIADNSVTAVHIATNAISGTLVADNSITSTHIAQNQVTATQIAQNTITVGQIADSAVETAKINNDAVTQAKIADDAVGPDQLAVNAVVSASIANGTIVAADLADNAVTLAKMASLARGKIIVGDSAGDPSALAIGSNGTVLKSDGTDVSWGTISTSTALDDIATGDAESTLATSSGSIILDSPSAIKLDADGGEVQFKDGGTEIGVVSMGSQNMNIESKVADKDIKFKGIDGSSDVTALTLDMSDAGKAIFNKGLTNIAGSQDIALNASSSSDTTRLMFQYQGGNQAWIEREHSTGYMLFTVASNEVVELRETGEQTNAGSQPALFLQDTTAGGGAGNGGQVIFKGHHASSSDGFREFAKILGLKEDATGGSTKGELRFYVNKGDSSASEAARFDSEGMLKLCGGGSSHLTPSFTNGVLFTSRGDNNPHIENKVNHANSFGLYKYQNSNGTAGSISMFASSVSYNTSSDYRLKENVNYTWNATTKLKQLKPCEFEFKADTDNVVHQGFLAHEVDNIVPTSVFGEKDGEEMQQLDHSKLVPLLVKTIQELEARIATLEG